MAEKTRWAHQTACREKAATRSNLALHMGCGTGKTLTTVDIIRDVMNQKQSFLPTLIFCPKIVCKKWRAEFMENSKISPDQLIILEGPGKKRLETFKKASAKFSGKIIVITNYESVQMKELYAALLAWAPGILVGDECHKLRNATAIRTKQVTKIANLASNKYLLTGSPVLNSPLDLFAQYLILDGGRTFGKNFFVFRATFFWDKNAGMSKQAYFPNWVLRKGAEVTLGNMLKASSFQADKKDCLTLPPFVRQRVEVELAPAQEKAYKEMEKVFITFVNGTACIAELAITKSLRLQQIITGFVNNDDGEPEVLEANPRLDALEELLEDLVLSEKVIVWCNFKENYRMIGEMLTRKKIKHVFLTGEQSTKEQNASEKAFNEDPSVRVLIGHPKAAGIGVDFIEASSMVYFSRSFSLEDDIQSEARNYRGGSEKHQKITRYDIVAKGTIDEVILEALERKENVANSILEYARHSR